MTDNSNFHICSSTSASTLILNMFLASTVFIHIFNKFTFSSTVTLNAELPKYLIFYSSTSLVYFILLPQFYALQLFLHLIFELNFHNNLELGSFCHCRILVSMSLFIFSFTMSSTIKVNSELQNLLWKCLILSRTRI